MGQEAPLSGGRNLGNSEPLTMQIRAPEAPREARRAAPPAPVFAKRGSEFLQIPSRGEGRTACRASWDRDHPGWMSGPQPILTR
eukprot:15470881-Alexandrium_andersonii.AAC.1